MRVKVFHVADGDCLLVSSIDSDDDGNETEHHILVDAGRKGQFQDNARDEIYAIDSLDLVYVSHIDDDHISGVVGLVDDVVTWRVHRRKEETGQPTRQPSFAEPPEIQEIWHNSLFEMVGDELEPEIEASLATTAATFAGAADPALSALAARCDNLVTGERSSMELSRRISARQLDIVQNRPRNQLMVVGAAEFRRIGPFTIDVIGPSLEAIDDLKITWKAWLSRNRRALRHLQAEMLEDEKRLGGLEANQLPSPRIDSALGQGTITEPNLASLMLLVKDEAGSTILLTGDGSSEDILSGLEQCEKLDDDGRLHVDILKVQHHGAEANVTQEFVNRVTADHYVFCGNGAHHNPEKTVVEAMAKARLGVDDPPLGPDGPFTFWFSSAANTPGLSRSRKQHMTEIEELVEDLATKHDPTCRFNRQFLTKGHHTIEL